MTTCTGDQHIQTIERTECVGNSLVKINNNFKNLDFAVCDLENKTEFIADLNVINSSTIDLNWDPSTRILSADVIKSTGATVIGAAPISVIYDTVVPTIAISNATTLSAGAMTAADKIIVNNAVTGSENIAGATGTGSIVPANFKSGPNLQFKKILGQGAISVTDGSTDVIISSNFSVSPGALAKAWVTFTYRAYESNPDKKGAVLPSPRILNSFNIAGVTRMTDTALYVTFASPLPYRSYAVVLGQATSTADGVTVSARNYGQVPSEFPLNNANLVGSADRPYKSASICKFESRPSGYLNEVYIAFF